MAQIIEQQKVVYYPNEGVLRPAFDGILADLESGPSSKRPTLIGMADWPARLKGLLSRWPRGNVP
jgi:hypothetical protein